MTDGRTIVARLTKEDLQRQIERRKNSSGYIPGPIERRENRRAEIISTKCSLRENMEKNWKLYYMSE